MFTRTRIGSCPDCGQQSGELTLIDRRPLNWTCQSCGLNLVAEWERTGAMLTLVGYERNPEAARHLGNVSFRDNLVKLILLDHAGVPTMRRRIVLHSHPQYR